MPGDTLSFVGVVRVRPLRGGAPMRPPEGDALVARWHLRDSQHTRLHDADEHTRISPFGTFTGRVKLPWSAAPGMIKIVGTVPDINAGTRGFSHRVEVIEPSTLSYDEATLTLDNADLVPGDPLKATLSLRHRAGFARAGVPVRWRVKRRAAPWRPDAQPDFEFGEARDGRRFNWADHQHALHPGDVPEVLAQGEGMTDEEGAWRLHVDDPAQWRAPESGLEHTLRGHWALTLEVIALPEGAPPIAQRAEAFVHPARWNIGVALDSPWVRQGASFSTTLIATTLTGDLQRGVPVEVTLHALNTHGDKRRLEPEAVDACHLTSASAPVSCSLTPPAPGVYRVRARATDQAQRRAHTERTVFVLPSKDSSANLSASPHATLRLFTDRVEATPGETAQIFIQSPYPRARGLLTWEHNGVLSHQVLELTQPSAIATLPITPDHAPQIHAAVALTPLPAPTAPETRGDTINLARPLTEAGVAHAAVALPVEPLTQSLRVSSTFSRDALNGTSPTLDIEVTDHKGLGVLTELHLTVFTTRDLRSQNPVNHDDTKTPTPAALSWRDAFHTPRAQGTTLTASPAGSAPPPLRPPRSEAAHHHSGHVAPNPDRSPFDIDTAPDPFTTATLSTHTLRTDAQGRASWSVPSSPPHQGTPKRHLRIAAIDMSDRFGAHTVALPSRSTTSPHPTTGLNAGDERTAEEETPPTRRSKLKPLPPVIMFEPGTGQLLPAIKSAPHIETLQLTFSASPRMEALDAALALTQSPLEDTPGEADRLLAATLYEDLIAAVNAGLGPHHDLDHALGTLLRRQRHDGFAMLPQDSQSDLLATSQVMWALQAATSHGLRVPKWALARGNQALSRALQRLTTPPEALSTRTHAALVWAALALAEARRPIPKGTLNALTQKYNARPRFSQAQLMATLALQDADTWSGTIAKLRRSLETAAVITPHGRHIPEAHPGDLTALMHHPARTDAIALYALMRVDPESPLARDLFNHLMSTRNERGHWGHSQAHAWIIAALHAYHRHYDLTSPDHSVSLKMGERALAGVALSSKQPTQSVKLPAEFFSSIGPAAVKAELAGDSPVYMHMAATTTPDAPAHDEFALAASPEAVAFQVSTIEPRQQDTREPGAREGAGEAPQWAFVDVYVAVTAPVHHVTWAVPLPSGLLFEEATPSETRWWATRGDEGELRLVVAELPVGVHRLEVLARRDERR